MGATQRENMDPAPYEVEFMNVVVDKANDLQVTDADSHFAQFADVHPSKIKQGKLFPVSYTHLTLPTKLEV